MDLERLEKLDKLKTRMLKYIMYKRRTEKEIIEKYKDEESDILEEAVETLKELGYIDDSDYVSRYIHDVMILKNISIFEIKYKLYNKGIDGDIIENYISNNEDELAEYELSAAKKILAKKSSQEKEEVIAYLRKKRYMPSTISRLRKEE